MAGVVLRAASVGSRIGEGDIDIVSIAEGGAKLSELACKEAEKLKEQARNGDNESNIRKQFLDNAISSIRTATFDQYNIAICTGYEQDDFQDLQGQILLLNPIDVEVKKDVLANFKVYIFSTGKYLRRGKQEQDHWNWWGETKKWTDDDGMHVHFENAQPKKSAGDIDALMSKGGGQHGTADADAATKQAEEDVKAGNEAVSQAEAEHNVEEAHQVENEPQNQKQDYDVEEVSDDAETVSDDAEEVSDDADEECDDVEEKGSEDEDAQSEDLREK